MALLRDSVFRRLMFWNPGQTIQRRFFYPRTTRNLTAEDVLFLNLGYEEDPPMTLPLDASDERNRYCIQLYHRTATQVDLRGKRVLEVGCGHGGGASYLVRALQPAAYTGLDLNPVGIAFCRARHDPIGLNFTQGGAEDLPFDDHSFEAVVNIESSLHYREFRRFLAEVARVLVKGGHFLYADFRPASGVADWHAALANVPMRMLAHEVINAEVLRGMERNSQQWLDLIDRRVPPLLRGFARNLTGMDSTLYRELQRGRISYQMFCLTTA